MINCSPEALVASIRADPSLLDKCAGLVRRQQAAGEPKRVRRGVRFLQDAPICLQRDIMDALVPGDASVSQNLEPADCYNTFIYCLGGDPKHRVLGHWC